MAYYKDAIKRKKTRADRLNEGGWEDEGKRYNNKASYGISTKRDLSSREAQQPIKNDRNHTKGQNQGGFGRVTQDARGLRVRPARQRFTQSGKITQNSDKPNGSPAKFGKDDNPHTSGQGVNSRYGHSAQPGNTRFTTPFKQQNRPNRFMSEQNESVERDPAPVSSQQVKGDNRVASSNRITSAPKNAERLINEAATTVLLNEQKADLPSPLVENLLTGRNPIREAIKSGRDIEKLLVARGDLSGSAREIISMAKDAHIIIQEVDRARLDAITPHHQGMLAFASAYQYSTLDAILEEAEKRNEPSFLVILDGITDPHNLGAIIRTAACAGAHGVIIPERRSVGLTPSAVKASAGSIEHIKVAKVANITRIVERLKEQGIWIFSADQEGTDYRLVDFSGPCALVIGSEGEGISRLVLDHSDYRVSLPMRGSMDSLNASVAAGILLYSIMAKR